MDKKHELNKRRSFAAVVVEKYLRVTGWKKRYVENKYEKYLSKLDNAVYKAPKIRFKSSVDKFDYCGADVYTLSKSDNPDYIILYLHGGAYFTQPKNFALRACDKIAQGTNALIVIPIYPLAPNATWKETYSLLEKLYGEIVLRTTKSVIIIGDSSGGGLAIGFCQYLRQTSLPQPSKIIAISPWLDVCLSNDEIPEYTALDPMLALYGARKAGELWAGELNVRDYRVSPIYGSVDGLNDVYLFAGTREILYPDVLRFYRKLRDADVRGILCVGNEMNHDYPFYPIPEGKAALKEICEIIKSN